MSRHAGSVTVRHHGADRIPGLLDILTEVWADAHTGDHDSAAAGFTPATLQGQITNHTRHDTFTLVTAHSDDQCVGFGYGFRCTPAYWFGNDLLPLITAEARTTDSLVGICELAVCRAWQGSGIGTRFHAEILNALQPKWVSLLALPGNGNAQRLYRRLGYRYAGPYRSGQQDGPLLDLLLLRVDKPASP